MCGITGLASATLSRELLEESVDQMSRAIRHRGPDDSGRWLAPQAPLAFGHQRLSIIDLSKLGHQPMSSRSERFTITYNGEIYNYQSIRDELIKLGHTFRGKSDTEVLLASIEEWGITEALKHCIGMFVFAVWDNKEQSLTLARDRIGIKPLYYGWSEKTFAFASELKAITALKPFPLEISRESLAQFFRYNYIPQPRSIYCEVYKLPPGTTLSLHGDALTQKPDSFSPFLADNTAAHSPQPYWNLTDVAHAGGSGGPRRTSIEYRNEFKELLESSVQLRMISDVPLGAFLSGGIDSSLVVAVMQSLSSQPVRTFSIGFGEAGYDEAPYANQIAEHLGTDHTELYVSPNEALEVIPKLPLFYDEPFADSSQIPTYLVSQLTRQSVTVSLSGDGGDELFGGYQRYDLADRVWKVMRYFPAPVRHGGAFLYDSLPLSLKQMLLRSFAFLLPPRYRSIKIGDKFDRVSRLAGAPSFAQMYQQIVSHWHDPTEVVVGSQEPRPPLLRADIPNSLQDAYSRGQYLDMWSYLPDDILVKVDRASMAVSLEARIPLLDHRIIEFAWRLPLREKVNGTGQKSIMRELLKEYVPAKLFERPKMGFGVPIDSWLRNELREWAGDLLATDRLRTDGYLHPELIQKKWNEHCNGQNSWHYHLWDVLMFQSWLDEYR